MYVVINWCNEYKYHKIYFFYFLKDFVNDLTLLFYILFYDINKQQLYTKVSKFLHSIVGFLDHISEKN